MKYIFRNSKVKNKKQKTNLKGIKKIYRKNIRLERIMTDRTPLSPLPSLALGILSNRDGKLVTQCFTHIAPDVSKQTYIHEVMPDARVLGIRRIFYIHEFLLMQGKSNSIIPPPSFPLLKHWSTWLSVKVTPRRIESLTAAVGILIS